MQLFPILGLLIALTSCVGRNPSGVAGERFNTSTIQGDSQLSHNIMIVYQDKKNHYWFGSWEDGLYRYDGKILRHFTTKDGLSANRIDEIREDQFGNLYFNTSEGIDKFDGMHFSRLSVENGDGEWKLEPDDLWFKCPRGPGQVYRYDGKRLHRLSLPKTLVGESYINKNPQVGYDPYGIYCVYKDRKGNVWFGGAIFGVCRYDGKTINWIQEEDVTEMHDGPSNGVRSIMEDKDGYFWFNTMYRYQVYGTGEENGRNKQNFHYQREKGIGSLDGKKDGVLNEYLSIAKDNEDHLWIVTYRDGVWKYDGKNITHFQVTTNGFENIKLFSIYKDNKGELWLGTHESGVWKFNGTTFEKFSP